MLSINTRKLIIFTALALCLLAEVHSMSTNGTALTEDRAFKTEEVGKFHFNLFKCYSSIKLWWCVFHFDWAIMERKIFQCKRLESLTFCLSLAWKCHFNRFVGNIFVFVFSMHNKLFLYFLKEPVAHLEPSNDSKPLCCRLCISSVWCLP